MVQWRRIDKAPNFFSADEKALAVRLWAACARNSAILPRPCAKMVEADWDAENPTIFFSP
jgi:hypothetical protein